MRGCSSRANSEDAREAVVPAHAGMFPCPPSPSHREIRGPRACGDVPSPARRDSQGRKWSPRMRGCSRDHAQVQTVVRVVPAHAGMFPVPLCMPLASAGGPRACGDVPGAMTDIMVEGGWSPRMRGCSLVVHLIQKVVNVVPAHAGMFPRPWASPTSSRRGPRACGDVPGGGVRSRLHHRWSPRMRGCSRR